MSDQYSQLKPLERQFAKLNDIYELRRRYSVQLTSTPEYQRRLREKAAARAQARRAQEQLDAHQVPDTANVEREERQAEAAQTMLDSDLNAPRKYYAKLRREDRATESFIDGIGMMLHDAWDDFFNIDITSRLHSRADVRRRKQLVQQQRRQAEALRSELTEARRQEERLINNRKNTEANLARIEQDMQAWVSGKKEKAAQALSTLVEAEQGRLLRLKNEIERQGTKGVPGLAASVPWGQLTIDKRYRLPWKAAIPYAFPLICRNDKERAQVEMLLLHLLEGSAPKAVRIIGIDTITQGRTFQTLNTPHRPICEQGFITDARLAEARLGNLLDELTIQIRDKWEIHKKWSDYKTAHPEDKSPYTVLLIHGAEELLLSSGMGISSALVKILKTGATGGILPILSMEGKPLENREAEKLTQILNSCKARSVSDMPKGLSLFAQRYPHAGIGWQPSDLPDEYERYERFKCCAERNTRVSNKVDELWTEAAAPLTSVEEGLYIPIGWKTDGSPAHLLLGDSSSNAFIGGEPGSGKSNLLHVIIHSLLDHYDESEVNLYIMDLKQGVEMYPYGTTGIPAVKLLATDCDLEFAHSLLSHLLEENERRAKLFRAASCSDYKAFRRIPQGHTLPRIVLLVDECQVLMEQGRFSDAESVGGLLERLVRQGRSQGIHLLLSSQSISQGMRARSQLWTNISGRIALACRKETSRQILDQGNEEAATITSQKQAILNLGAGQRSANQVINIPLAKKDEEPLIGQHLETLAYPKYHTRFYNGAQEHPIPPAQEFRELCSNRPSLLLGQTKEWDARPYLLSLTDPEEPDASLCLRAWLNDAAAQDGFLAALRHSAEQSPHIASIEVIAARKLPRAFMGSSICHLHSEAALTEAGMKQLLTPAEEGQHKLIFVDNYDMLESLHAATPLKERSNPIGGALNAALREHGCTPRVHFIFYRTTPPASDSFEKRLPAEISIAQGGDGHVAMAPWLWMGMTRADGIFGSGSNSFNIAVARKGHPLVFYRGYSATADGDNEDTQSKRSSETSRPRQPEQPVLPHICPSPISALIQPTPSHREQELVVPTPEKPKPARKRWDEADASDFF